MDKSFWTENGLGINGKIYKKMDVFVTIVFFIQNNSQNDEKHIVGDKVDKEKEGSEYKLVIIYKTN